MYPLFQELSFATRRMISATNTVLRPYGITYSQWVFIVYLSHHRQTSLAPIASYYQIERPAVTAIKNMFLQRRWIQEKTGQDRRERIISLTKQGTDTFAEINVKIRAMEHQFLALLTTKEQTDLQKLLYTLNQKEIL